MEFEEVRRIFDEGALLVTFFGALGGSVRAAVLRTSWLEALRVIFIGGATAFGFGVLSPAALQPVIDLPPDLEFSTGTRCGAAFLIGVLAVSYVERLIDRNKRAEDERDQQGDR